MATLRLRQVRWEKMTLLYCCQIHGHVFAAETKVIQHSRIRSYKQVNYTAQIDV